MEANYEVLNLLNQEMMGFTVNCMHCFGCFEYSAIRKLAYLPVDLHPNLQYLGIPLCLGCWSAAKEDPEAFGETMSREKLAIAMETFEIEIIK